MIKYFLLIFFCSFLFACKKDKVFTNGIDTPKNFSIEKGRSIRTVVEVIFPESSIYSYYYNTAAAGTENALIFFQDGLLYDTVPGVELATAIKVPPSAIKAPYKANNSNTVPAFLYGLKPNTTYYIKGYRIITSSGEIILSDNEIKIKTTDEIIYNNLSLSNWQDGHRIGYAAIYTIDYYAKVAGGQLALSNYEDMLMASMEFYVDNTRCQNVGSGIYSFFDVGLSMSGSTGIDGRNEPLFNDFVNNPQIHLEHIEKFIVSVPCSFAPGSHDIKLKFDGYWSTINTNQQAPYPIVAYTMSLSKTNAIYDDYIYINGLDSLNAARSHAVLLDDLIVPIEYDNFSNKHVFKVPQKDKGLKEVRLYNSCDNPLIGNLTIE